MKYNIPSDVFYVKKKYKAGEFIFSGYEENPNFYLLTSGSVNVMYLDQRGDVLQLERLTAPDFFGEIELLSDHHVPLPIVAADNCETLVLARAEATRWLNEDLSFCHYIMKRMAEKFYRTVFIRAEGHFLTIRQRLLLTYNRYKAEGRLNELTKQELCEELGVPIRSLNRVIAQCSDVMIYEHKHFRPAKKA